MFALSIRLQLGLMSLFSHLKHHGVVLNNPYPLTVV